MCGILGGINTGFTEACVRRLDHRGPDQADLRHEPVGDAFTVTLGQTRLNIVDRHDIELPVRVDKATILFNGEIYNYIEIRKELQALGWSFKTSTDTEVALVAYLQWGHNCLTRFNGMWAIAIWDGERYFCARDRMGKKPLFYRSSNTTFEFASEAKAFPDLEFMGHELFDLFEFAVNETTLFRGVLSLKPGNYLYYDPCKGTLLTASYWDIPDRVDPEITDPQEAVERFVELLTDSVRLRMRADVPVTLFLSGGLDSSIIAGLVADGGAGGSIKEAFTCQFEEFRDTINEEHYARDLAKRLGIEINIVTPTKQQFVNDLSTLAYHLEMPTGSFSVFPLYCLARACHQAGYKVILSGEGSDELFAGYARNEFLMRARAGFDDDKAKQYSSMLARYDGSDLDRFVRMASRSGLAGAAMMRAYLSHLWSDRKSLLENMCYIETRVFIQPLLQMGDRMCMANSIEGRCPFLDYRLVEFAFSLSDDIRFREQRGKWIVHEAAKRVLPQGSLLLGRTIKHGLPTPVNLWMQGRHSFDRKYWNAIMSAECIKSLHREQPS